MPEPLTLHWAEYGIEAGLLGGFMVSACTFGVLLGHPDSPLARRLPDGVPRRAVMGIAMGLTAIALIYSPWGQRSGAHMNPAFTVSFALLGKVAPLDAVGYVFAQFVGGIAGVLVSRLLLGARLRHAMVKFVVTDPGPTRLSIAWLAEVAIALVMMGMVLVVSNNALLAPYTGLMAGGLVAMYITFEAPLSGMSLNPARTFGSALVANHWRAIWIYFTAPLVGMLLASAAYAALPAHNHVYCAKLCHPKSGPCIFRCEHDRLESSR